ncbi:MAG: UvrD-helicase domain-containing protein [Bacilli bacterium]|nr:UvrD-helicase domain-containing protein [Bacilli bacterium]
MWTKEQLDAIEKENTNIIVSAGAGSGKTAVLTERVLRKLKSGVNIDQLLVLTFTKAAAKEMKDRIKDKIKSHTELANQLPLIDRSYITTFDSFAFSIVRKYHYILNISKDISIEEGGLIKIQKIKILDQIFDELYQQEEKLFIKFISDFCIKDDKEIKNMILNISDKLDLIYDKINYLNNYIDDNFNDKKINKDIDKYINLINKKIDKIEDNMIELGNYVDNDYYLKIKEIIDLLIESSDYESIKNNCKKLPMLPRNSCDEAKNIKESIQSLIDDISDLCSYENTEEMKNQIYETKDYVSIIIKIILLLENKIDIYKNNNELYTFNDIAKKAIFLLKENENIKNELKYSFNEIMIDEYQDTSDIQEEFINLIQNNNVYMVGDIKQSIYRFRNANPYIFKNKYDLYKRNENGYKIDLNKNFRSRKEVLSNINEMFNNIMEDEIGGADYKNEHQMIFGNVNYDNKGFNNINNDLEIYNYNYDSNLDFTKDEIEIFIIANDIKNKINSNYKVMDKKTNELRNANYDDFVILMDKSKSFNLYKKIFEYLNIPLTIYKDDNMIDNINIPLVKNIISLAILENKKQYDENYNFLYMSISRSYLFEHDDNYIFNCIKNKKYDIDLINKINIVRNSLNNNISSIISLIINEFEFYNNMIKIGNVEENIIVLDYLIKTSSSFEKIGYDIEKFDQYLNDLIENKIELKFSLNKENNNSVKIMTIHASKGLEYSICYYSGLYSRFNITELNDKILYNNNIVISSHNKGFRNTIYKEILKSEYFKEEISERIRLFYVALTRAREKMIIVSELKEENKLNDKMKFKSFKNIIDYLGSSLDKYIINIDINRLNLTKEYNFKLKKEIISKDIEQIKIDPIYIDCEEIKNLKYSKNKINYLSIDDSNKMKLGTDIHYILENIDFKNPDLDNLNIGDFYKEKIKLFLKSNLFDNVINVYKEIEFEYQEDDLYHGIIDLILEEENKLKIVDYKLKEIDDEDYIKQLNGYKKYLQRISDKNIEIYLYSIIDNKIIQL